MVGMSFAYLSLVLHNSYIYLSIFQHIFCHNSLTAWQILSSITIWAIGPMAHVPAKFHPDIFNIKTKLDNYDYAYNNNSISHSQWVVPLTKDNVSPGHSKSRPLAPFDIYIPYRWPVSSRKVSAEKSSIWPLKVTPGQRQCYQTKGQTWFPITSQ